MTISGDMAAGPRPGRMLAFRLRGLARKLALTALATAVILSAALLGDYLFNVVLFPGPGRYTPLFTSIISLVIGAPISSYLIGKKIDADAMREQLSESVEAKELLFAEMTRRREETEQALQQLKRSESLYRLLADNSSDVISLWGAGGRCVYVSPSAERLFGYTQDDLLARPGGANIHPDDLPAVQSAIAPLTPTSGPCSIECRILCKDGHEEWVDATFQSLGGGDSVLLSSMRIISPRKRLELQLIRALDESRTALSVKADFLANMTHELRTPLNAIVGFSGLLKGSAALSAEDARMVGLVSDASETLLQVVNDVLDFSKLEAGAIEFDRHPFDPLQIAESTAALLAEQARAKGLELVVTADGPGGRLLGDGPRLRQVLLNFVSNAIKFTPRGRVEIHVRQADEAEGRRLRVEVRDTGIGVSPEQIAQIFERFTQADASVSRQYGGTGLGLAICKRIIQGLEGEIGADSAPGQGSTFWFEVSLPVADSGSGEAPRHDAPAALERPLRLLVVDDNAVNRELICRLLAPFELEIETADDGVGAVQAASRGAFDLILMDVQMPNMDGLTATRRIRASASETGRVPIIAMTANVLPEQVARCLEAGMDDHLGKPIDPHALLAALNRWSAGAEADA